MVAASQYNLSQQDPYKDMDFSAIGRGAYGEECGFSESQREPSNQAEYEILDEAEQKTYEIVRKLNQNDQFAGENAVVANQNAFNPVPKRKLPGT